MHAAATAAAQDAAEGCFFVWAQVQESLRWPSSWVCGWGRGGSDTKAQGIEPCDCDSSFITITVWTWAVQSVHVKAG
jgi:hypothetical protein